MVIVPVGDDRYWKAQKLREMMVDQGEAVKRSVQQRIYDIAGFKIDKEAELNMTSSSEKISLMYKKNVKLARSSEPISNSFVDSAITTYKRVLGNPANQALLNYCHETYTTANHPFTSIYALQALCNRASNPARINFGLDGLIDHYRMGSITLGEFAVSKLKDYRQSYVAVLNYKHDARSHLLGGLARLLELNSPVQVQDEVFASHFPDCARESHAIRSSEGRFELAGHLATKCIVDCNVSRRHDLHHIVRWSIQGRAKVPCGTP